MNSVRTLIDKCAENVQMIDIKLVNVEKIDTFLDTRHL